MVILIQAVPPVQPLPVWQFVMAIAVAPAATIAAVMWTWSMNNKRADQVKTELSKSIQDLGVRVTELKVDLSGSIDKTGGRIAELKGDVNTQMSSLKSDFGNQANQLRSDFQGIKSDVKDSIKTEMEAGFAKVNVQLLQQENKLDKHLNEILQKIESRSHPATHIAAS